MSMCAYNSPDSPCYGRFCFSSLFCPLSPQALSTELRSADGARLPFLDRGSPDSTFSDNVVYIDGTAGTGGSCGGSGDVERESVEGACAEPDARKRTDVRTLFATAPMVVEEIDILDRRERAPGRQTKIVS
jgi:hypothetical protein